MKAYFTLVLLCSSVLIGSLKLKAQSWKSLPIKVEGKIVAGLKAGMDSISVIHYSDCILFGSSRYKIPVDSFGRFHLLLKPSRKPGVLKMAISGNLNLFMNKDIEPGDSILINIDATEKVPTATFSGNITLKYECEQKLNEERRNRFDKTLRPRIWNENLKDLNNIPVDFAKIHQIYYKGYIAILDILESYSGLIPRESLEYLKARHTHFYLSLWEVEVTGAFERAKTKHQKEELIQVYKNYRFPEYNYDIEVAAYNEYYLQYLLEKFKAQLFLKSNGNGFNFRDMYYGIKNTFTGVLREQLLVYFLLDPRSKVNVIQFDGSIFDDCLSDAQQIVQSKFLQQLLMTGARFKKGTAVPDFSMLDTEGNLISIKDFKGSAVLIDVWGEGCSGCARFHKVFDQFVYPKLARKSELVIISIGVNPTKKGWLRGIRSGLYTKPSNINLFTQGLGMNHPFIRHYGIQAIPFVLLIDKNGLVYSKIDISLSATELVNMINEVTSPSN